MAKYVTILIILLFAISCESPWDIDTPRKIILPKPVDSVPISLISIYVETNGSEEPFILEQSMLEIDTVSKNSIVWGNLTINRANNISSDCKKLEIVALTINLNKIAIGGNSITLGSSSLPESYASYIIHRGINTENDTTIICDTKRNKTELTFSQDKEKRVLWIYLDGKIFDKRFVDDNGKITTIQDSLFVNTRLRFNY
jgi:hypothetical protein